MIFGGNTYVSLYSLFTIERAGAVIAEHYIPLVSEFGSITQVVERSQKYINILAANVPEDVGEETLVRLGKEIDADYTTVCGIIETMDSHAQASANEALIEQYNGYKNYIEEIYSIIFQIRELIEQGDYVSANKGLAVDLTNLNLANASVVEDFQMALIAGVEQSSSQYRNAVGRSRAISVAAAGVFLAGVLVIVYMVHRMIVRPAVLANSQLGQIMADIHRNEGDLTERIDVMSDDEIGMLTGGINEFLSQLQQIMKKIKSDSETMQESIDQINHELGDSTHNVGKCALFAENRKTGTQNQRKQELKYVFFRPKHPFRRLRNEHIFIATQNLGVLEGKSYICIF